MLIVMLALFASIGNILQVSILLIILGIMILSLVLKSIGKFYVAGILAVCSVELGLAATIVTWSGFSTPQLSLYSLLVQTGFVVIAFFNPVMIFIICVLNCAFILVSVHFLPISQELAGHLAKNGVETLLPLINLQVFVSIITLILMSTLIRAISRANRAEEIAIFERREREQKQRDLELKMQLEEGIEKVLNALNAATSTSNFSVRVPLARENILWRIGSAVNNLLARLQGLKQEQSELEKTRVVARQLAEHIQRAEFFAPERWTGTCLDPLIIELNKQTGPIKRLSRSTPERPFPDNHGR